MKLYQCRSRRERKYRKAWPCFVHFLTIPHKQSCRGLSNLFVCVCVCVCVYVCMCSVALLYPNLCDRMDTACQTPLAMEFSRQEYWSGLSFPTPEDLPSPGMQTASLLHLLHWQADSLPLSHLGSSGNNPNAHKLVTRFTKCGISVQQDIIVLGKKKKKEILIVLQHG